MRQDASAWIDDLWRRLGLGSRSGEAVDVIDVDGLSVRLSASDSGRAVVVEADGGFLPQDPPQRAGAVKRLLAVNLALLTGNLAGVWLADAGAGRTVVRVTGAWPLGAGGLDGLIAVIDDVVYRAEMHRRELAAPGNAGRPRAVAAPVEDFDPRFIIRP